LKSGRLKAKGKRLKLKGKRAKAHGGRRKALGVGLTERGTDVGGLRLEVGGTISTSQLLNFPTSRLPSFPAFRPAGIQYPVSSIEYPATRNADTRNFNH
jgi:hypothetical protein